MAWVWWSLSLIGALFCFGIATQVIIKNRLAKREFQEWILPTFVTCIGVFLVYSAFSNLPN